MFCRCKITYFFRYGNFFLRIALITYFFGQIVRPGEGTKNHKKILLPAIILIGILTFYKYASLVVSIVNETVGKNVFRVTSYIVPIGLSFVVFESVS